MSKNREILIRPVVSEKSLGFQNNGVYSFIVDIDSNAQEIKKAVKNMFNVPVKEVNIVSVHPKKRRVRFSFSRTKAQKKAFVTLEKGYSIDSLKIS